MSDQKTIFSHKPQISISVSSTARMWLVSLCVFLCVLQSAVNDEGKSLIAAFTALVSAVLIELLLTCKKDGVKKILDGSAAATALILAMLLPNQIHPVYVFFGAAFAIIVVKYSFGGLGSNWLNPALGGWLFIRFSWPSVFSQNDAVSSVSEISISADINPIANSITDFFNSTIFQAAGVQLPSGYIDLLFLNSPGLITDRGLFALLIGTVIITAVGINRGWIPLVFLTVYGFLVRFAADANGIYWNGDMLYGIFSGGTIAAAFILAAEPASSAKFKGSILFTVILGAFLSWFFRYKCMEYSGCFFALALVNCITPLVRIIEDRLFFSRKADSKVQENLI